ncbi:MAG: L-histidine N(alpha)-methyltransferase [Chloroflexaceae bacterium]|nr:L-histidine N(alpha)-methyltransferase [Chloroflexaceae bacterium]
MKHSQATLSSTNLARLRIHDLTPTVDHFREEVIAGLQQPQKTLPSKFLYDKRGSELFDHICELPEYYPTRTELSVMRLHVDEMAAFIGEQSMIIEYGSGSSVKSRLLLNALQNPAAYVPVDISRDYLLKIAATLAEDYPNMEILPVCADYTAHLEVPEAHTPIDRRCVYFPGSTLGNYHPNEAAQLLQEIALVAGPGGGLLLGLDLKKDPQILHRAYNDQRGITAAFNLNLLTRINRELGANFNLDHFHHYAPYNPHYGRVEMHIASLGCQQIHLGEHEIPFQVGETIWTECSYKYTVDEFTALAASAGLIVEQVWTDECHLFSIQYLTVKA